jgi:tRNA threonylcarbamoyladenosine biosynthesis protein TsaE
MRATDPEEYRTTSEEQTRALGREMAGSVGPGSTLLLFGELGSGKTCLAKGIAAGLGIDPRRVHSPSFIMVNRHRGRLALNHVDLYRLEAGEDFSDLGLEELFDGDGVTVVEWADRLPEAARPVPRLEIHLSYAGDEDRLIRVVEIHGP